MLQHRWLSPHNRRSTMWCKFGMRQLWNYADFIFCYQETTLRLKSWAHGPNTTGGMSVPCHPMLSWIPQNLTSTTQVHHCHAHILLCLSNHHCSPRLPPAPSPPLPSSPERPTQIQLNTHIPYYPAVCKLQIHAFIHDRSIAPTKRMSEKTWCFGILKKNLVCYSAVDFCDTKNIKCQVNSRKLN